MGVPTREMRAAAARVAPAAAGGLVVALMVLQLWSLTTLWLRAPVTSSYELDDLALQTAMLPALTLCPWPPLNLSVLVSLGFNSTTSGSTDDLQRRIRDLDGLQEEAVAVAWREGAWRLGEVVYRLQQGARHFPYHPQTVSAPGWTPTLTPLGPCFTYRPLRRLGADASYQVTVNTAPHPRCSDPDGAVLITCSEIEMFCNTSCAWQRFLKLVISQSGHEGPVVILHPPEDPPTLAYEVGLVPLKQYYISLISDIEVLVGSRHLRRLAGSGTGCNADPSYSEAQCRQMCGEPCHPRAFTRRPPHPTWAAAERHQPCMAPPDTTAVRYHNLSKARYRCLQLCRPRCHAHQYTYNVRYVPSDQNVEQVVVTVRASAPFTTTVTENLAYPTSRLLSDAGGGLGLWLGASLFSIWLLLGRIVSRSLTKTRTRQQLRGGGRRVRAIGGSTPGSATRDGSRDEEAHWVRLWHWSGLLAMLAVTCCHVILTVTAYVHQSPSTALSVSQEQQPFPAVVLCPDMPFTPSIIANYGYVPDMNVTYVPGAPQLRQMLHRLPLMLPAGADLRTFWRDAARDLHDFTKHSVFGFTDIGMAPWRPVLTTNNVCYQLDPARLPHDNTESFLGMEFNDEDLDEEMEYLGLYRRTSKTVWLSAPNVGDVPLLVSRQQFYAFVMNNKYEFSQELVVSPFVVNRATPCHPAPYSRLSCLHRCLLRVAAERVGCTLPYLTLPHLPQCRTPQQHTRSLQYVVDTNAELFRQAAGGSQCEAACAPQCHTTYYLVGSLRYANRDIDFKVKMMSGNYLVISQFWALSLSGFLCQLGGVVGLYLGWSILNLGDDLLRQSARLNWRLPRCRPSLATQSRPVLEEGKDATVGAWHHGWLRGLLRAALYLGCLMVGSLLFLERLWSFVVEHPYYSTLNVEPVRSQHFPALTVCRWPPFNLSRLMQLGLQYNTSEHCQRYGPFIRCYHAQSTLTYLPGVWTNLSLDQVWRQAAWTLPDLVTHYTLDDRNYSVRVNGSGGVWREVVTEYNRCFTLVPRPGSPLTSLSVTLNTDYRGQKRLRHTDAKHKMLLQAVQNINPPHTLFRLHPRQESVLTVMQQQQIPNKLEYRQGETVSVQLTLTRMQTLPRRARPCQARLSYSQDACKARCRAAAHAAELGCRLPHLTWTPHVLLCNDSLSYARFPRHMGNVELRPIFVRGGLDGSIERRCHATCSPACTTDLYTQHASTAYTPHARVIVSFAGPSVDNVQEQDGYTWPQLLADVGGVAGVLGGVSLLSLLHGLPALLRRTLALA